MKGTQWVIKTPRLKCRCGATIHMENRGKWRIIYDSPPDTPQERDYQKLIDSHRATPTSTLSTPYDENDALKIANAEEEAKTKHFEKRDKQWDEQEPPPKAEDDSDG